MSRKICVVSGTRAEFGLLRWLMHEIDSSNLLELQLVVTGMHLSPEYGSTYREIEEAGFVVDNRVEMLLSTNTPSGVAKSIGVGIIGFADALERLDPDFLLVLGDRFEILAATTAALVAEIPIAHIHGGETTEGAFDEAIRHSITKMSHLHFVGAEDYRRRVVQLGEDPDRVFDVGGLGIDAIRQVDLLSRKDLEAAMDFELGDKNLLVTFHPVTLEGEESSTLQMRELLAALKDLRDTKIIITMPNSDTGRRSISELVEQYVSDDPNAKAFTSLGQLKYLSCMKLVDAVVGNSSSGLAEAPSMGVATINIGDRQKGRLQAASVINCTASKDNILEAVKLIYSASFQDSLAKVSNPYGNGGASKKIAQILEQYPLQHLLKKKFYDLKGHN